MKIISINLDSAPEKFETQRQAFAQNGMDIQRFSAITDYTKHIDEVTPLCKKTCAKVAINIAMSHKKLAEWLLVNDPSEYAMILEDDVFPMDDSVTLERVNDIVKKTPQGWDILQLHCDANCTYIRGSHAAYLISKSGQEKMKKMKIKFPAQPDIMTNIIKDFNKITSREKIFWTDEKTSLNRNNSRSLIDYLFDKIPVDGEKTGSIIMSYNAFRLGDCNVCAKQLLFLLVVLLLRNQPPWVIFTVAMVFFLPV